MLEVVGRTSAGVSARRLLFVVSLALVLLSPALYIGNFAGDSQVHLIYGENAARGHFFEFNQGEKSPGVTSPGYMLLIAGMFKAAPDMWVPGIVKGVNLLFWYGFLVVIFLVARQVLESNGWAWIATLAAGLLPGSVYNSTIGMENGIFGFLVFLWIYLAGKTRWLVIHPGGERSLPRELLLGALLGVACWVRPEGFIVAGLAVAVRGILSFRTSAGIGLFVVRTSVFLIPFLLLSGGLASFHFYHTGYLVPGSGLSRILISNISHDTVQLGPIFVSLKFATRLAAYFPLTAFWLAAHWLLFRGYINNIRQPETVWFLIILFWTAVILYSTVLGSVHLSRYIIFVMPGLVLAAVIAARWLWESWEPPLVPGRAHLRTAVAVGAVLALGGVFLLETEIRLGLDSQSSVWKSMRAPAERQAFSGHLFNLLGQPQQLPISLALEEVQARYWLDTRFVVRSLDGRIDPVLLDHANSQGVDHVGYLKARNVGYLLATPRYNRNPESWSLDRLSGLSPGESLIHRGLKFSRIPIYGDRRMDSAADNPGELRWFADADGVSVLRWFMLTLIKVDLEGTWNGGPELSPLEPKRARAQ